MKIVAFVALACLLSTAAPSMAQEEARSLGLHGIGGELGLANPEIIDGTVGFGVQADLGDIRPNLAIVAGVKYWSASDNAFSSSVDVSEISLNGDAYYHFPIKSSFRPFAGAGVAFTNTSVSEGETTFGGGTGFGLNLFGGARYPASTNIDVYSEARLKLGSSSFDAFTIKVGAMYLLNK